MRGHRVNVVAVECTQRTQWSTKWTREYKDDGAHLAARANRTMQAIKWTI